MEAHLLEEYIKQQLPAINAGGIAIESLDEQQLTLSAPLALNHNDRNHFFGGSIFNLALMACWGTLYLECRKHMERPNIVTRDGQIRYRHPCTTTTIQASCRNPLSRQWEGFFAHYEKTGQTSISLTSKIINEDQVAAYFDGVFVLLSE